MQIMPLTNKWCKGSKIKLIIFFRELGEGGFGLAPWWWYQSISGEILKNPEIVNYCLGIKMTLDDLKITSKNFSL